MIARDNLINAHLPEDEVGDYSFTAVGQGGAEPAGKTYAYHAHHRAPALSDRARIAKA